MGFFQAIGQQYAAVWNRLSAGHKLILILLVVLCGAATVGVVFWAGSAEYEILYSDLSAKDCSALVAGLKDAGIQARIAAGGGAVMVPANKVYEARMVAAEKGVPASSQGGLDAFREPKIGMSPFAERVNYIKALQDELARTIAAVDSVLYARVHLVVPERALFKKDQKKASASVLVVTKGGVPLPREKAVAITNLVASAVEGLAPEDVTITDGRGNVLAGGRHDGPEMVADDQFAYRARVEAYLSEKAETMLTKVLGPGRAEVRVSAELDFKDSRETKRTYDPEKRVVVSEKVESTKTTGKSIEVGGPAGSPSNTPGQPASGGPAPVAGAAPAQQNTTENTDTKYLVSESLLETINRGATVKRLTVAAFVDTSVPAGGEGAAPPTTDDITRVIKDAIGLDETRGDSLKIAEAKFHAPAEEMAAASGGPPPWVLSGGQYLAIAVLGVVLLFVARRALKSIETAAPRRVVVPEILGAEGEGAPAQLRQDDMVRREIANFVQENPEAASRMLEGWVEGEE
jgi:flagellar M-ring protein FliF